MVLVLDERLVVGEDEPAAVAALVQLDRPRQRAGLRVRVVVSRPVRDVEVGSDARVEAADRRIRVGAGQRHEERVVRRRRLNLPAVRIEDQRPVRVVRDQELELQPVEQRLVRLNLGLRGRRGAAIVVGRKLRARALVVVAPIHVVVPVRVDAVVVCDLSVAVVVAEVLPPQPFVIERVLVAVRVRDDQEPKLTRVDQVRDLGVLAVVVDELVEKPAIDLRGDPLPCMNRRHVQHVRTRAVGERLRVLRHLQRDDLAALERVADHFELHDLGVATRDRVELIANAVPLVVRAPDVEAGGRLGRRALGLRAALLVTPRLHVDALRCELRDLGLREDKVCLDSGRGLPRRRYVVAVAGDFSELRRTDDSRVEIERGAGVAASRARPGSGRREGDYAHQHGREENSSPHDSPLLSRFRPRGFSFGGRIT